LKNCLTKSHLLHQTPSVAEGYHHLDPRRRIHHCFHRHTARIPFPCSFHHRHPSLVLHHGRPSRTLASYHRVLGAYRRHAYHRPRAGRMVKVFQILCRILVPLQISLVLLHQSQYFWLALHHSRVLCTSCPHTLQDSHFVFLPLEPLPSSPGTVQCTWPKAGAQWTDTL